MACINSEGTFRNTSFDKKKDNKSTCIYIVPPPPQKKKKEKKNVVLCGFMCFYDTCIVCKSSCNHEYKENHQRH